MLAKVGSYAARSDRVIVDDDLGAGIDGIVVLLESDVQPGFSVLKMHFERGAYLRERDAYLHLRDHQWRSVCGCEIPSLLAWDDAELALEMSFVKPPFVLDFAQAFLFWPPEFPDDVWEATYEKWREQFGADWGKASAILDAFEAIDVYMLDPNPHNFRFR
jgi:hypothetical protein